MDAITISLMPDEQELLLEALDSHAYWQLGYDLPRIDGLVWLRSDEHADRWWPAPPSYDEAAAISAAQRTRALAEKLAHAGRTEVVP